MNFLKDPVTGVVLLMTLVLVIVAGQRILPPKTPVVVFEKSGECKGAAIPVEYAYDGMAKNPHTCAIQCEDQLEHYILYTNNVGTQCDTLPYCNDRGEDDGVTCTPPPTV